MCRLHPQDLILHGDIAYGAEEQFANEAKMAVRLANFLSAFLQVSYSNSTFKKRITRFEETDSLGQCAF